MSGLLTGNHPGKGCPNRVALAALLLLAIGLFGSCKRESFPKPKAYPRIAYPNAQYQPSELLDLPVSFEYPIYATLEAIKPEKKNWINLHFNSFNATLYMSLIRSVEKDALMLIQAKEKMAIEQAPPASEVRKEEFEAADKRYTGYFYLTDGNAPCPVQFILTNHHGLLFDGSLIFDEAINRDSLASVVEGLTRDVRHLVETFQFKN
jgi:gliding motility-associated lipoprotein GldD